MKKLLIGASLLLSIITVWYIQSSSTNVQNADLVIFSYNRPLQLYALLESIQKYVTGINEIHVIYRASTDEFNDGYEVISTDFSTVSYHKQGTFPLKDFKPLTLKTVFESPSAYIIFAVDDIVVKDNVNIISCIEAIEKYNAYGFYLRLGMNLTNCYSWGSLPQPLPAFKKEESEIISWQFNQGKFDWIYPHTVDMTLYRKQDIESDFKIYSYHSPNTLEVIWNRRAHTVLSKKGLCYTVSKIVNMPLNRVQNDEPNRAMTEWKPEKLLQEFIHNKKMDIEPLHCIHNTAAHMEYQPLFKTR